MVFRNVNIKKDVNNNMYCDTCWDLLFTCLTCDKKTDKLFDDTDCYLCNGKKEREKRQRETEKRNRQIEERIRKAKKEYTVAT